MRHPDDIKKGLSLCIDGACDLCPYGDEEEFCSDVLLREARHYINYLENQWGEMVEA